MRNNALSPRSAAVLLSVLACAQHGFKGDSPALAQDGAQTPAVLAALAFRVDGDIHLRGAAVVGELPSKFRFAKPLPAPPAVALKYADVLEGAVDDPPAILAAITVVPPGHPSALERPETGFSTKCGTKTEAAPAPVCLEEVTACRADGSACANISLTCDDEGQDCRVTSVDGDPELLKTNEQRLAGRSRENALLYVASDAPAGSMVSQEYAAGGPLAAGYHLLERLRPTSAETRRRSTCFEQAELAISDAYAQKLGQPGVHLDELISQMVVADFNAKFGTAHRSIEDLGSGPQFDEIFGAVIGRYERDRLTEVLQRGCMQIGARYAAVGDADSRELGVTITGPAPALQVGDLLPGSPPWRSAAEEWL